MSKTKNTEEFRQMMEDQEMAAAFDYQEKEALMEQLSAEEIVIKACAEFVEAHKALEEADTKAKETQKKLAHAIDNYAALDNGLTIKDKAEITASALLSNMFKGFNPNDI
jgi:hypothetical protein